MTSAGASLQCRVLGGLAVTRNGTPVELGGPKQRAVLASLLVASGRPVSPDRLVDRVWGESPPARADASLQAYVSNLRRALEPDRKPREPSRLLVTRPAGYALELDAGCIDVARFEAAARDGHELVLAGRPEAAIVELDAALSLWAGPPLPEMADEPWVVELHARLGEVHAQAFGDRVDAGLAAGEHDALIPRLEAAVVEAPFRERLRAQLALALYRAGRQRDALAALAAARAALVEEAGLEPGPELRRLEARILEQSPELDAAPRTDRAVHRPPPERPDDSFPTAPDAPPAGVVSPPGRSGTPFLGRERELDVLLEAARAAARAGRPVVIRGEPGIGKTRLVEELAARLPDVGVAWGRCPESAGAVAYWPCIQIGRQLEGADALDGDLAAELLPSEDAPPAGPNPAADRFGLHVAVVRLLRSAVRPLLIVVDDLQWADPASLRAIEFVASELAGTRVLLVVTTRPVPPDADPALLDCLAELARQPGAVQLEPAGLSTEEVARWLDGRDDVEGDDDLVELIHGRSEGNPFFVGELIEMFAGEARGADRAGRVPAAVGDVIRRRIGRLPAATQQLLATASVVGRAFDADVLAATVGTGVPDVLDQLEPATEVGLVLPADLPGRFQFSHALVADTLAAELSPIRRARLHAAVAAAIETRRAGDLDAHLPALAHHAFEGAAAGTADRAVEWAERAARDASSRLALEDAVGLWRLAVRARDLLADGDRRGRTEALASLARAQLDLDDVAAAYDTLVEAIDAAIALGDAELVARLAASTSVEGLWFAGEIGLAGGEIVGAIERALDVLEDAPTPERALATAALAENLYWIRPADELDRVSGDAVEIARACGDPAVLGRALHKRNQALWRPTSLAERAEAADELLALVGTGSVDPATEAVALFGSAGVDWEAARVHEAQEKVRRARELAVEVASPALLTQLDYFHAAIDLHFGRYDAAAGLIDGAHELYRRTRRWAAQAYHDGFMSGIWLDRGAIDQVHAAGRVLLDSPYRPWFAEAYAMQLCEIGELDRAEELVGGAMPPLVDCWMFLGTVAVALHARVGLGRVEEARQLAQALAPYEGRLASMGTGPAFGDVAFALARAADLLGDHDSAGRLADVSVEVVGRDGVGPWLARVLRFRAGLTGSAADADRADAIVEELDLVLLREQGSGRSA